MKVILTIVFLFIANMIIAQELHPYLQALTPNSIIVNWKTSSNTESTLELGSSKGQLDQTVTGFTNVFSDVGYNANYYYHTVKVENLQANTKYYYRIKTGSAYSAEYSFKTLPMPGQAATEDGHIRFLLMGDNQLKNEPRYDTLVSKARAKVMERFGGESPSDNIALTFMVGDQVDVGTLDHYEWVHLFKNRKLSGYVPIQTTVGNHETYGTLGMEAYYSHFYLDQMSYQGVSSGTENYYAIQAGNVLFISFSSEHTGTAQFNWLEKVLDKAKDDNTVEWIISFSHRPYEAEQYVGDISQWIKNNAVPRCMEEEKYLMHVGAHHHIYSRGQFRDKPVYNIISGGTAWDQYWGMSTEKDFEYIQKTISNWMYQIVDVDVENGKIDVESYSIGSIYGWKDNQIMDTFHRYKNQPAPNKPSIITNIPNQVELPFEIQSSVFSTTTNELLNSTEFQFSTDPDFSTISKSILRDYENLYGAAGRKDTTQDLNLGVDILRYKMPQYYLANGQYYVRVRHRDRNLEWSAWSDVKSFEIINSMAGITAVVMDTNHVEPDKSFTVQYINGPGNAKDWIGIYKEGQVPENVNSIKWSYVSGSDGKLNFTLETPGMYYVAFFENDGYTEIAERVPFFVGPYVRLSVSQTEYPLGAEVQISSTNAPNLSKDWVGIYKVGHTPKVQTSTAYKYTGSSNETFSFSGVPKGYYWAAYFLQDSYTQIGDNVFFQVGDTITKFWLDKEVYELGEEISASWTDAPGIVKDWIGIYAKGDDPEVDPLEKYVYFDGKSNGNITLSGDSIPSAPGEYFAAIFTNDSYQEVSNRSFFTIEDNLITGESPNGYENGLTIYPNPGSEGQITKIESKYPIDKIVLLNMQGSVVYETNNVNNQKFSLINMDLPKGTYTVQVHTRKVYRLKLHVQ